MLTFIRGIQRSHEHFWLAVRVAEALVAVHGRAGVERAYAEASRATDDTSVGELERRHLNLVATIARKRFLQLEHTHPDKRRFVYTRWLDRRGQMISVPAGESPPR